VLSKYPKERAAPAVAEDVFVTPLNVTVQLPGVVQNWMRHAPLIDCGRNPDCCAEKTRTPTTNKAATARNALLWLFIAI